MTKTLTQTLHHAQQDYTSRTPKSKAAIDRASDVLPGGNTRSVLHFPPYPLVFKSASGGTLTDIDGHSYKDFLNDFSAGLYGHSQAQIQAAIVGAMDKGLSFGGINQNEEALARVLVERFPALEKVRFTNSGTEANIMALTTARVVTGRDKILVMRDAYYGNCIYLSPAAARTNAPYDFVFGRFNDLAKTEQAVKYCEGGLAAILVETMMGAGGCIPADKPFLQGLRDLADRTGAVLIFDEVVTSRFGAAGAQGEYGITPDMMSCGKYLGGGGTFGAFGGRADLMAIYDANRADAVMHGGTFNNNVITMAAGLTGLRDIYTPEVAAEFLVTGNRFREELNAIAREKAVAVQAVGVGSVMTFHFHNQPVRFPEQMALSHPEAKAFFHLAMLERGIYLASRAFVSLSIAQTEEDFSAFKVAFADVLDIHGTLFNQAAEAMAVSEMAEV